MIRLLKLFLFLTVSFFFLFTAALFRFVMFLVPRLRQRLSAALTVLWARSTLAVIGISVSATGTEHLVRNGMLAAANHQSYLDIIILASVMPALFVAKKEVRTWPLLGWLATLGGTLYIDRNAFRGAVKAMESIVTALQEHVNVVIFPEGTSTNGEQIVRFKPALFRSALVAECPVLPVTITYRSVNGEEATSLNRDLFCWYGDMTFTDHFWKLLNTRILTVSVVIHPPILHDLHDPNDPFEDAEQLSDRTFNVVSAGFASFTPIHSGIVNTVSR